ncbi:tetratricopeptide repeat protein [Streptomyces sp. MSC1_001]|jgi:tetratricopeptide (TPR) repeat protein|uniref:tetratricopeptide repeat protein n=2 Tax=unclassified Streptomyces TaxID=2593676 RepID=UPI002030957A|nr:tetratricopeptide repeat protein [Streptomyces sp. MSC1_001]
MSSPTSPNWSGCWNSRSPSAIADASAGWLPNSPRWPVSSPQLSAPTAKPAGGSTPAASEDGDNQLEGALTVRSAIVSLSYGTPASAHEQAARARHILGDTVGPATTRGLLVEARTLARMGRGDEALPLLRQAEDAFGRLTAEDRDDPSFGHTERQFLWHLGNAWTHLGRTEDAWQVERRALDPYPPTEYLDPALIRLGRATCLAQSGEPEEAYRTAAQALTCLPDEHRTGMVMKYATDFSRTAGHGQLTAGKVFAELLRA